MGAFGPRRVHRSHRTPRLPVLRHRHSLPADLCLEKLMNGILTEIDSFRISRNDLHFPVLCRSDVVSHGRDIGGTRVLDHSKICSEQRSIGRVSNINNLHRELMVCADATRARWAVVSTHGITDDIYHAVVPRNNSSSSACSFSLPGTGGLMHYSK